MRRTIALACVVACSAGGPTRVGTEPSWRRAETLPGPTTSNPAPVTFAPTTEPAARYNEPVQAPPHTALGDAVVGAVRDAAVAASLPAPIPDARLFRACAELAEVVPEEGVVGYSMVEFALQRNGIIEPSPHLLVVWGKVDDPDVVVRELAPKLGEILGSGATSRIGVGAAKRLPDGTGAVVFALQGSAITTAPIPRSLRAGASTPLEAVVESRYRDPEVFVTHDDGSTERLALETGKGGAFRTQLQCAKHTAKQQVEVTASDAAGSTVLANFPIWCGTGPPLSLTVEPTRDDLMVSDPKEAEQRLLALVNRDRVAAGLPALLWDDRVAAVARAHSEEMRRTKIVAHISPTTGSGADRVRVAGIKTAVVLENVARSYGVAEAHAGLMNSPGHRANIMSPTATHIGIGVVLGDEVSGRREMFLTQVFIRITPKVDPSQAADLVRTRITAVRSSVRNNTPLQAIAQTLADGLAQGRSRDAMWPAVRQQLDTMGAAFSRVGSVITAVGELDAIDGKALLGDYKPDEIGVGIAQGMHPEIGENAIWIVVLMAEKR